MNCYEITSLCLSIVAVVVSLGALIISVFNWRCTIYMQIDNLMGLALDSQIKLLAIKKPNIGIEKALQEAKGACYDAVCNRIKKSKVFAAGYVRKQLYNKTINDYYKSVLLGQPELKLDINNFPFIKWAIKNNKLLE